jgi:cyclophilin family peptidyl-prolyl cis-trans isomerase
MDITSFEHLLKVSLISLLLLPFSAESKAQKPIYDLQKSVVESKGKTLSLALESKKRKIQLEGCYLAATWGDENSRMLLDSLIRNENKDVKLVNAALFALGQIGSVNSVTVLKNFIAKDHHSKCNVEALVALVKCLNAFEKLPEFWNGNTPLNQEDFNAMARALVFSKGDPSHWMNALVNVSVLEQLNEEARVYLASALAKPNFKELYVNPQFVDWVGAWFSQERNELVRMKLHRTLRLMSQPSGLQEDLFSSNERISSSACAQLTAMDSSVVFKALPQDWRRKCKNRFVQSWLEVQFDLVNFDQIRTVVSDSLLTVDQKVVLAKAWNKNGHVDAQNTILFHFFESESTLERMQWVRCMTNSYHLLDSLVLSLESFAPAVQYAIVETALATGDYLHTPGYFNQEDEIILHASDFGVQALVADYFSSNQVQFARNQQVIELLKNNLRNLQGSETIETRIAITQALGAIDPEHVYINPMASIQLFPSYQTWRKNKRTKLRVKTDEGAMVFRLDGMRCPMSVANVKNLAKQGYYANIVFHRVIPEFVAQAGCTRGDGMSGMNAVIHSEFSSRTFSPYTLGMASAGKHTESAQFFITLAYTPHLNGRYTQFGRMIGGSKTIERIHMGTKIIKVR